MKILWITNTLFPDICEVLQKPKPVIGGWMYSCAKSLLEVKPNLRLGVASLYDGTEFKIIEANDITYFLLPEKKGKNGYPKYLEYYWKTVKESFQPNVVHIHGSEYPHGLAYLNAVGNKNVVGSIQGLVGNCSRYYYGNISIIDLVKNITLRDIIRMDTVFHQKKAMQKRGFFERNTIASLEHIIGRTTYDKFNVWAINPYAKYHFNNEILRDSFYSDEWKLENCRLHSIFLSQAHYPIKGLHKILEALPLILQHFPDTRVYIAGNEFLNKRFWRINGFGKYINFLIKKNQLKGKVFFQGQLSELEMRNQFLKSHIFVCPSSIENSPNSIGEAQLLGVPCVASYVGGMSDIIKDNETGLLYRFEEIEMLAKSVCNIFSDNILAKRLSINSRNDARMRHSKITNTNKLIEIYNLINDNF